MPISSFFHLCCAACSIALITGTGLAFAKSISAASDHRKAEPSRAMIVGQDCTAAQTKCEAQYILCVSDQKDRPQCERAKALCLTLAGCSSPPVPTAPPPKK
jgi:hypothetical protein